LLDGVLEELELLELNPHDDLDESDD